MASARCRAVFAGTVVALVLNSGLAPTPATADDRPWMNKRLSPDRRAALLLARMTLEEKVDLVTGDQGEAPTAFYNAPIPRLGIPALRMADASAGIAPRGWTLPGTDGRATAMPSGEALTASFNPQLGSRYAGVVGDEARETGHDVLLGPNADIMREPFWGRTTETESEDPLLTTAFTTGYVRAIQKRHVIATLKHYTGYNQETNRLFGQNSIIRERALHEVYVRPYADAAARAHLGAVMCSFNKLNGTYACENRRLLTDVLRGEPGFKGFVMTDFGAAHSTVPTIRAGMDMETGTNIFYDGALLAAVRSGQVSVALVNRSVLRILRTMFAIGLFDTDYTPTRIPVRQHGTVAAQVQDQAITLLKNSRHQLPLPHSLRSIAVIGGDANITAIAGGSARVDPTYQVSPLEGIRRRAAKVGAAVRYARGNDPVNGASMIETRSMTAVPSSVLTPAGGYGSGLTARYWANTTLTGTPAVTRVERQVNYDTGFVGGSPALAFLYASQVPPTPAVSNPLGSDQSARYTGSFTAPKTGTYRLGLTGWGDARLFLDGRLLIDMTGRNGRRSVTSPALHLVAGQRHALRIDYAATRPLTFLQPGTLLLQWSTPSDAYSPAVRHAMAVARASDVAVVYVRTYESEERDRVSLKLPQGADQLIRAVRQANPDTVVALATAGPVTMPWLHETPAVLQSYFGGQEEGTSLARVLFGDVNPSGRLPLTYPRDESQLPPGIHNPWFDRDLDVRYSEGIHVGYRGYLKGGIQPLFPFGYGLSYTTFRFSDLRVRGLHTAGNDTAFVRVRVRDTGRVSGAEVVQVYVGRLPTTVETPVRALAGFAKIRLRPGEQRDVLIPVSRLALSYWDTASNRWVTPRGAVRVYVGKSVEAIELTGTLRIR